MSTPNQPPSSYSDDDVRRLGVLTDRVVAARRAKAAADADEARALADAMEFALTRRAGVESADSRRSDIPVREVAAEIAAATRASDRTIQARLDEATVLVTRFPKTVKALARGEIERGHVSAILDAGTRLDDASRKIFERAALEIARRESPGRLRPLVRMIAHRIDPVPLQQRHRDAMAARGVWVRDGDDGMADLLATLPAAVAHGIQDRLTQMARLDIEARERTMDAEQTAVDTRTLGEVRADVLSDLLLTGHATAEVSAASTPVALAIHARVQITVPATTLTGADGAPAELVGHGPIDAETARRLAAAAPVWIRLFTDAATDCVTAVDQYRSPLSLRRLLAARDEHCRFPGCRQPVWRCDLDHTMDAARGGPTTACNLAHLCRRHHVLKHNSAWTCRQLPGGVLEWTSPAGRIYTDVPARALVFTEGDPPGDPPPF